MAHGIGGLPGGAVNPKGPNSGGIRPPVGEGQGVTRPGAGGRVPDGSVVEGLVTSKDGENYQVRIGAQLLNARATIPLFVGQRFRAVWDASTTPPMLRLQQADMAVLARFSGRDQQIAMALLSRGLPVKDDVLWSLRQQWMQNGGDPAKLGTLVELWARGAAMTEGNVALLAWYAELSPTRATQIWKKIRERLHERVHRSPASLLAALKGDGDGGSEEDAEVSRFLKAHALAGKPARRGLDPSMLLTPAWWPVGDGESGGEPTMARVAVSSGERNGRRAWWVSFELEGQQIGPVLGDVMTNGRALSIALRLKEHARVSYVRDKMSALRDELKEIALQVQHIGVGEFHPDGSRGSSQRGLDMEA